MVYAQKIVMAILFLTPVLVVSSDNVFLEKTVCKKERGPLSQIRREALEAYESLAHQLTTEIEMASAALHKVLDATRDLLEGKAENSTMQMVKQSRKSYINMLESTCVATQQRLAELQSFRARITPSVAGKEPEQSKK